MKIKLLFLVAILISTSVSGQYVGKNKKKQFYGSKRLDKPIYRWVTGDYERLGIHFSIGPTYMMTKIGEESTEYRPFSGNSYSDSLIKHNRGDKGKIGIVVELGLLHITKRPRKFIQYYDWAIGVKYLGGSEQSDFKFYNSNDSLIGKLNGNGDFSKGYLYGRFDVHNVFQMNPYLFMDQSLGINTDISLFKNVSTYKGYRIAENEKYQQNFLAQIHYSLGLGVKPNSKKGFYFVPSVEIPIMGVYEWNTGSPQIHWFSSKYYPIMLKLKFAWLFKKDPKRCPPVFINDGDREFMK